MKRLRVLPFVAGLLLAGCGGLKDGSQVAGSAGLPARPLGPGEALYAITPSGRNGTSQLWTRPLSGAGAKWQVVFDVPDAASAPTSVSWTRMRTDVFYATSAGKLAHTSTADFGQTYAPLDDWGALLGYKLVGRPDSTSWGEGRIDVVCLAEPMSGGRQIVAHASYDSQNVVWESWDWSPVANVMPQSNPTITSWSNERLDVFVVGSDGQLWHKYLDIKSSPLPHPWEVFSNGTFELGNAIDGVSRTDSSIDLFTAGSQGTLLHWFWPQVIWETWIGTAGTPNAAPLGTPSVARTGTDGFDVLAVDSSVPPLVWRTIYRTESMNEWVAVESPPALPPYGIVELTAW